MLTASNVSKSFGTHKVLRSLNLKIEDGSIFGLVGVNGAGKSTLLRLIAGVYQCDDGRIEIDGKDVFQQDEVRSTISFVSDDLYFPLGSTVKSLKTLYKSLYRLDEEKFVRYAKIFGISEGMRTSQLSKGMKRRVSLVFALATSPKVLMLDEAYDGLEPIARHHLKQVLAELVSDEGLTVIIASHSLKELEDICDHYGILQDGYLKSTGDITTDKGELNKYQVVLDHVPSREEFDKFNVLRFRGDGRVAQIVIRGSREDTLSALKRMNPLLIDVLPVTFEEMFIFEVEEGDLYE